MKKFTELKSSTIQEWTGLTGEDCNLELSKVEFVLRINVGRMHTLMKDAGIDQAEAAIRYPALAERIVKLNHWLECINKARGVHAHTVGKGDKQKRQQAVEKTLSNYRYIAKEVPQLVAYQVEHEGKRRTFILTLEAYANLRRHLNPTKASIQDVKRYINKMKRNEQPKEHSLKV